jgi:hypothetical protein
MTESQRRREVFANPFFVVLMATSVIFVITVLGYLISPSVLEPGPGNPAPGAGSREAAAWLDRNTPWVLAIEFAIMLLTGVLAMATDPWFSPRAKPKPPA